MSEKTSTIGSYAGEVFQLLETLGAAFLCIRDAGQRDQAIVEIVGRFQDEEIVDRYGDKPIVIEASATLRSTELLRLLAAELASSAAPGPKRDAIQLEFSLVVADALQELLRDINERVEKGNLPPPLIVLTDVDQLSYDSNIERVILALVRSLGAWRFLMTGDGVPWYLEKWLQREAIIGPKNDIRTIPISSAGGMGELRDKLKAILGRLRRKRRGMDIPGVRSWLRGISQLLDKGRVEECLIQIWLLMEEFWCPPEGGQEPDGAEKPVPFEAEDVVEIASCLEVHSRLRQAKACYEFAERLLERRKKDLGRRKTSDDETRYNVRLGLAKCDYVSGKLTQAEKAYSDIADDAEEKQDYVAASRARYFRAKIFFYRDWLSDATRLLKKTKTLNGSIEDEKQQSTNKAYCDFWQGRIEARRKSFCKAESYFQKAKEAFVQYGVQRGEADLHSELGNCLHEVSSFRAGEEDFEKALSIDRVIGYGSAVGHELNQTIVQLRMHGPSRHAEQFLLRLLEDERSTEMNKAAAWLWLGKIYVEWDRADDAKTKIDKAYESYENMGMRRYKAACRLARIRALLCESRGATEKIENVMNQPGGIRECLVELADVIPTLEGNEDLRAEELLL